MNDINSNFSFKFVDQDQVFKNAKMLDGNKASQKNDITIKMVKTNIDILFYILYFISSLTSYILFDPEFPSKLKEADIASVYKKVRKYLKENYRPVSVLPNVSKIEKRLIYDHMNAYFEVILSNIRCSFPKRYNVQHCLILLIAKCHRF